MTNYITKVSLKVINKLVSSYKLLLLLALIILGCYFYSPVKALTLTNTPTMLAKANIEYNRTKENTYSKTINKNIFTETIQADENSLFITGIFCLFIIFYFSFYSYGSIRKKKQYLDKVSNKIFNPDTLKINTEHDLEVANFHKQLMKSNNENKFLKSILSTLTNELNNHTYIVDKDFNLITNLKEPSKNIVKNTKCFEFFYNKTSPCNWCSLNQSSEGIDSNPCYKMASINDIWYKYKFIPIKYNNTERALMVIANNVSNENIIYSKEKENEEYLNKLYNGSLSGIIVINNDNKIVLWNQISEKIFGYSFNEIKDRFFPLVIKFNKKQKILLNDINNILNDGTSSLTGETIESEVIHKNGSVLPVEMTISPYLKNGSWQAIIIIKDISSRILLEAKDKTEKIILTKRIKNKTEELDKTINNLKMANKKLIEANKLKSKFLICLSHELKTPLNGIIGFCDLLSKQYYGKINNKQDEYLSLINRNGKHLLYLINNLLDFSKVDKCKIDFLKENSNIKKLILDVLKVLEYDLQKKSLKIDYIINEDIPDIFLDSIRFKQVFLNLVSNSIKFSKDKSKIVIKAEKKDNDLKISVTDFGIGIKEEHKEKIFMEFFQADSVRDKALGGTGIGLALAKKLVELQGGSIGVESAESQGSTFWFTLPIHA